MAVINVPGPVSGRPYRVNIAGDAPTPEEQARIDQYVAQNEAPYLQLREQYFGAPVPVEEAPEDTGPDTSFRGALASAVDQPLENIATTSRMLGAEGIGDFLSGLTETPENYESAITGFMNEDGGFYDFSYLPRAAVEQVGQIGGSLLTRAAGAGLGGAAGSVIPGVGTAAGAVAGGLAGPFLFEALQLLGPIAQERAANNGRETPNQEDWLGAVSSSSASGALNAIAPNLSGFVKRLIVEGGTEGIQSIIQQTGETALTDVGLDISLREAGAEALLAGTTIGAIDAPGAIMRARGAKAREREQADEELTQDINEMIAEGSTRLQYADQIEAQLEGDQQVALSDPALIEGPREALALPAPRAEADPEQDISDTEFENLSFDRAQYDRVFQQIKADTAENKPINIPAIQQRVKSDIPGTTVSQIRDIMRELQARGFVEENPTPGKNKYIAMGAIAPELKTPDVSYRRQIDTAAKFIKDDQTRLERLNYDLRSAEQFGRDLDGKKVTPNQVNQKIATIENRIKENQGRIDFANQRLQTLGQDTHVPRFEKVGVPSNVKAVPIPEGTAEALRPRFEAQKQTIKGLREQLTSLNKQVRKLNEQAKKRQLSSNEFSRMEGLRSQQADISKRLGEAEANLKSPEKIFQEAKGEQFREQERQRDIQKKLAAARARAVADAVKEREDRGLPPRTPQFTAQQGKVFSALSKRLKNLGLKDIKLEGQQRIEGAEGFFDPTNKTIGLAMGVYDPNMTDQQLFDAISEVMNHEVIHALRAIGVLKADEITTLENVAEKTQYVKRTNQGVEKRKYTYLDRAKRLYPNYTPTQQKEEAIAEMFRDYTAGRLKLTGKPRTLFERIKDFFKSIIGVNRDAGFTAVEDIFEGIRRGEIGARERVEVLPETELQRMESRLPELPMAPEGTRAHKLPYQLLMSGTGEPPSVKITQKYTPGNAAANNAAIQQILDEHPDALTSVEGWAGAMQAALGGDFVPAPPMVAINYAASPEAMAEKLRQLTPELRKGVDKGFEYVEQIRDIYQSGNADPRMTLDLFVWGILSRGKGPVQQEGAFIDIIDDARPFVEKAINQPLTEDDLDIWLTTVSKRIPEGSPGRQATNNVNDAGKLLRALSQFAPNSNRTVIDVIHEQMSDPNASAADVRQIFLSNTEGAGVDNKVLSFILLVGGKDDVLVMDRIQGRHMWDDGRFGGANIYDGIGPQKEGLTGIFRGPVGVLTTRILEDGMRRNVQQAYDIVGRPDDASLGRWHWETWVIEGEQVVSHDTLAAVINRSPVGTSVTEGKTDTFSSGMTYRRGEVAPVVEYPLSNENTVYMKPERFKEFTGVLAKDATRARSQTGVFTDGKFKITERADIPWFERPEVDRTALDALAMEYENARPDGSVLVGTQRARRGQDASQRGNSDLDRRYSRVPAADQFTRNDTAGTSRILERRVPFRGLIAEPVRQYGTPDRPVYEIEDPQVFTQMIKRAKADLGKLGAQVTDYTEMGDSYEGKRLFLFDNGYSGFALNGDDIVSVFSVPGPAPRGAVKMIMPIATAQGGRRLDAFDTFLPKLYAANGFRAVARLPFNREFAPEGWDFDFYAESFPQSNGEPDVVFMVYDPADASENTSNVIDDYDRGGELQEEAILKLQRKKRDSQAPTQGGKMYSRLLSTTALNQQVQEKKLNLSYARASDFIAKGLGLFIPKNRAQEFADKVLVKFQDNMLPVGRMIQELQQKGLSITDAMDTYLREELYHGVVGAEITARENTIYKNAVDAVKKLNVSANMMDALQRVSDSASGKTDGFVKQARETSGSERLALADAYLYARHAKERNAFMRRIDPENNSGSGMTDREADAILNWFNSLDPQNRAAIADLDTAVRAIVADTNNTRVQSGMLPEEFDTIVDEDGQEIPRPQYQYYVPLRGFFDPTAAESDGVISGGGSRFGGRGRPDPQALGRYQYATNILGTTIDQNQRSVDRGERNKVGQSFLNLLRANPEMTSSYARILDMPPQRRAKVGGRVRMITDFRAAQDPNIFVVKENGKDVYVEIFNEGIAKALKGTSGTGSESAGAVVRTLGTINRYLSNINTSYNPEFFITNFFRDLQTAGVNIQQFEADGLVNQVRKDIRKSLVGIKRAIMNNDDSSEWSQIYKDFVAAGGQNSLNQMSTAADQMNNIRNLLGDIADQGARGKWNQVKNSFVGKKAGSLLSMIENYNTVIENGIRVVTYKALLDRGFSRERAAQAARNVTVNFAKGGEYKTLMNAYSLFYNASIQGSFAMLNAALRSKKVAKIWAGVVVAGILQDQLNAFLSEEDDDETLQYDKIPDYILEHNLILPDPFGFTDRSYIAIPMPYGLNMAHNMGRAMSRAGRGQYDAGEAAETIVGTIANTISPIGDVWNDAGLNLANLVAPTVADPFIDVIQNQDYAGRPVYKDAFPGDRSPDSQRYWSTTNPSAIWVAQNLNELTGGTDARSGLIDLSPDVLNFWLEFGTGGVGRFVQRTAEAPMRFYTEGMSEEIYREIPFVRKIIGSVSEREDYGRYIEKRDSILLAGDELRAAIDNRDFERARSAREQFTEELRLLPRVRAIDNAIRNVNRRMNSVRDANIPDERKQQLLDALDERKQALIARGNQLLADYR